jgi:hypothetical protein
MIVSGLGSGFPQPNDHLTALNANREAGRDRANTQHESYDKGHRFDPPFCFEVDARDPILGFPFRKLNSRFGEVARTN